VDAWHGEQMNFVSREDREGGEGKRLDRKSKKPNVHFVKRDSQQT
jgi:hypothetical protein